MGGVDRSRWEALGPWLDRALELPLLERARWLESLQGDDPSLAAELAALLGESDDLDREGFLEGPGPELRPSLAGQTLGAWTLDAPIGQGGMGTVWLARRADGRYEGKAAVKLLNLGLPGRVGEERFRREGSILGRLAHPNIARLIDAGISAGGSRTWCWSTSRDSASTSTAMRFGWTCRPGCGCSSTSSRRWATHTSTSSSTAT